MINIKRLLLAAVGLCVLLSFVAGSANGQGLKIGFVKDDRIKLEFKAWQLAQEQWDVESKAWDDEAAAKNTELQELVTDYEKQKLILSDEKRKEKEAEIRAKQEALDAYTRQIYGPGGTAERKQAQLLQPLLERVTAAIEAVAVEGNYDVVFTLQSGLGYIKETYDVTDKVLEYLETAEE